MTSNYTPINCEFHDVLEATATTRRRVAIVFIGEDGQHETVQARITDLQASNGVEHMLLDDGRRIRLDAIVSVDGASHGHVPIVRAPIEAIVQPFRGCLCTNDAHTWGHSATRNPASH